MAGGTGSPPNTTTPDNVQAALSDLELDIHHAIQKFTSRTGLYIDAIYPELLDVTSLGGPLSVAYNSRSDIRLKLITKNRRS